MTTLYYYFKANMTTVINDSQSSSDTARAFPHPWPQIIITKASHIKKHDDIKINVYRLGQFVVTLTYSWDTQTTRLFRSTMKHQTKGSKVRILNDFDCRESEEYPLWMYYDPQIRHMVFSFESSPEEMETAVQICMAEKTYPPDDMLPSLWVWYVSSERRKWLAQQQQQPKIYSNKNGTQRVLYLNQFNRVFCTSKNDYQITLCLVTKYFMGYARVDYTEDGTYQAESELIWSKRGPPCDQYPSRFDITKTTEPAKPAEPTEPAERILEKWFRDPSDLSLDYGLPYDPQSYVRLTTVLPSLSPWIPVTRIFPRCFFNCSCSIHMETLEIKPSQRCYGCEQTNMNFLLLYQGVHHPDMNLTLCQLLNRGTPFSVIEPPFISRGQKRKRPDYVQS